MNAAAGDTEVLPGLKDVGVLVSEHWRSFYTIEIGGRWTSSTRGLNKRWNNLELLWIVMAEACTTQGMKKAVWYEWLSPVPLGLEAVAAPQVVSPMQTRQFEHPAKPAV